jgi:hypothetical protein
VNGPDQPQRRVWLVGLIVAGIAVAVIVLAVLTVGPPA